MRKRTFLKDCRNSKKRDKRDRKIKKLRDERVLKKYFVNCYALSVYHK